MNRKKRNAYMLKYYHEHKERISKQIKERRLKKLAAGDNSPRVENNVRNRRYYWRNRKTLIARGKAKNWNYDPVRRVGIRARHYRKNYARNVLRQRQAQAEKVGLPFTLTEAWYESEFAKGCAATGLPFEPNGSDSPWVAHIDRKVPSKGYTPQNCRLVCACFNLAKKHWTDDDVLRMASALVEKSRGA